MTSAHSSMDPFDGLAEEACATLRDCLDAEGLTLESAAAMGPFERAVRAAIAAVESAMPADLPLEFALAYLTGRIAREQALALQQARSQVNAAREVAERRWQAAIETERRRLARASTEALADSTNATETPRHARST